MSGKRKGYLVIAGVFVLGCAAGGGASFAFSQSRHAALLQNDGKEFESRRLRALAHKLDLDADQEARIQAILARDREESRVLSQKMVEGCGQSLRAHKAEVDGEIRAVLRPDQQQRYDRLVEERREHLSFGPR